jgi:glycosyltransferase involved in cell wall biosynthesis
MIPVHNCAQYLARALPIVVQQLPRGSQVVVVDDASTDDAQSVVEKLGDSLATYVRNEVALGAVANFNRCLLLAHGELVHLLHGDDAVRPGFYDAMDEAMADPEVLAAVCRTEYIDESDRVLYATRSERRQSGPWSGALSAMAVSNRIRPSAIVVRRTAYERVGGFREDLPHAADWEMWARIAAAGPMWFVDRPLAQYRTHPSSDTAARVRTGSNVRERVRAIRVVNQLVAPDQRRRTTRAALAYASAYAARTAGRRLAARDLPAGAAQAREAVRCAVLAVSPGGIR